MFEEKFVKQGYLFLIGGAEDRRGNMVVLKNVVKVSKAKNIVIIPTASNYTREVINTYYNAFKRIGVDNVKGIDIRYRDEVDQSKNFDFIKNADLVFFSGGDQKRLVEIFENTQLLDFIKQRFFDGLLHIAGTSAGAAAVSDPVLFDGDYNGFSKNSINSCRGFRLLEGITIDTHFLARERIPRLSQFLISGKSLKGIGIDEDTCIIISPDLRFNVIGSGMVTVINADKVTYSNHESIQSKEKFSVNNLRIGFLSPGTKFSLKRWSILKTNSSQQKEVSHINRAFNWN